MPSTSSYSYIHDPKQTNMLWFLTHQQELIPSLAGWYVVLIKMLAKVGIKSCWCVRDRDRLLCLFFYLLCYAAVLKFFTYYAQYYAHVISMCWSFVCINHNLYKVTFAIACHRAFAMWQRAQSMVKFDEEVQCS